MLELLNRAYDDTYKRIENVFFDKNEFRQTAIIALYASIIELTGNAIILLNASRTIGVNVIVRSVLDAHIDLINLIADPNYLDQMRAAYTKNGYVQSRLPDLATTPCSTRLLATNSMSPLIIIARN